MASQNSVLNPTTRARALDEMAARELDVLVIGAGVVGAGAALDAASRGLTVGLVEARDMASGTSSRSSKLVHGGLRYLKQLNFSLVFEALRERSLILDTLCPHLARPVEFVYPLERRGIDRGYVGLGIGVYDVLGAGKGVPSHHKHLSKRKTLESFPGAKRGAVHGGIKFYEGQLDDARHTMMIARTAAEYGAYVATSARVVDLVRQGERVVGATVRDLEAGREITVRAKTVVNATGVWTDDVQKMVGKSGFRVQASKGVHIVVPRDRIQSRTGLITETEKSLLFIIPCPWSDDFWVIGTTDTPWDLDKAHPAASQADIDYILDHANSLLETPLTRDDVVGVYAGLRPLLAGESDQTSKLSREHACVSPVPGLVIIAGGKYTTYRVMAEDAVNEAVKQLPGKIPASCTDRVPLVGADGYQALWNTRERIAERTGLDVARVEHLLGRFGSDISDLLDLIEQDPSLAEPVEGAPKYLKAEVVYAVSFEGALHLDDILARRLRVSIDTWDRGEAAAPAVAKLVAPLLGWDDAAVDREIEHYHQRVTAERESQLQVDDMTADAARLGAPEVRVGVSA
ncbi:glycerol-3-phosphate dehydrogenase/oxidase [Nakamurella flava]|uniref:glycerol-3-phosphate dehydrogenase n=1 Tax=Nakamurella flava TaxID=2576308 RepID=A0A4U6QG52_9ACTN|nr:glycerol-3-phosphate dehydrogenase/oxidase [Nakamurella flava]TKV59287.1 glycerol-3-phosphate dehydrogenase/oxidase [Nakamurella flava]